MKRRKTLFSSRAVSNVMGFVFTIIIVSSFSTSVTLITKTTIEEQKRDVVEAEAKDLANLVANELIGAINMKELSSSVQYEKTVSLPDALAGYGYTVEVTNDMVYVNASNGVSKSCINYCEQDLGITSGIFHSGSSDMKIKCEGTTTTVCTIDFGTNYTSDKYSPVESKSYRVSNATDGGGWDPLWYDPNYPYRMPILIDNSAPDSEDLFEYPVRVTLTPRTFDYERAIANPLVDSFEKAETNFVFVEYDDSGDPSELPYCIDHWNENGRSIVQVLMSIEAGESKSIYVYYGSSTYENHNLSDVALDFHSFGPVSYTWADKKIPGGRHPTGVAVADDGMVYVVGWVGEEENSDWFIRKYDKYGGEHKYNLFSNVIDGNGGDDKPFGVTTYTDGNGDTYIYVVGYGENLVEVDSGKDWWIKKFTSDGIEIVDGWNKIYTSVWWDRYDIARSVAVDPANGDVYVGGSFYLWTSQTDQGNAWMVKKFDKGGNDGWSIEVDDGNTIGFDDGDKREFDVLFSVKIDEYGDVIIYGNCKKGNPEKHFWRTMKLNPADGTPEPVEGGDWYGWYHCPSVAGSAPHSVALDPIVGDEVRAFSAGYVADESNGEANWEVGLIDYIAGRMNNEWLSTSFISEGEVNGKDDYIYTIATSGYEDYLYVYGVLNGDMRLHVYEYDYTLGPAPWYIPDITTTLEALAFDLVDPDKIFSNMMVNYTDDDDGTEYVYIVGTDSNGDGRIIKLEIDGSGSISEVTTSTLFEPFDDDRLDIDDTILTEEINQAGEPEGNDDRLILNNKGEYVNTKYDVFGGPIANTSGNEDADDEDKRISYEYSYVVDTKMKVNDGDGDIILLNQSYIDCINPEEKEKYYMISLALKENPDDYDKIIVNKIATGHAGCVGESAHAGEISQDCVFDLENRWVILRSFVFLNTVYDYEEADEFWFFTTYIDTYIYDYNTLAILGRAYLFDLNYYPYPPGNPEFNPFYNNFYDGDFNDGGDWHKQFWGLGADDWNSADTLPCLNGTLGVGCGLRPGSSYSDYDVEFDWMRVQKYNRIRPQPNVTLGSWETTGCFWNFEVNAVLREPSDPSNPGPLLCDFITYDGDATLRLEYDFIPELFHSIGEYTITIYKGDMEESSESVTVEMKVYYGSIEQTDRGGEIEIPSASSNEFERASFLYSIEGPELPTGGDGSYFEFTFSNDGGKPWIVNAIKIEQGTRSVTIG